jgi:hypothetical protein
MAKPHLIIESEEPFLLACSQCAATFRASELLSTFQLHIRAAHPPNAITPHSAVVAIGDVPDGRHRT